MSKSYTAIGLMSGTSMDGIDAAIIKTDGQKQIKKLNMTGFRAYSEDERELLRETIKRAAVLFDQYGADAIPGKKGGPAKNSTELSKFMHLSGKAHDLVTRTHEEVVEDVLQKYDLSPADIDVVGLHGQTVLHRPLQKFTLQLGYGEILADRLAIPVVADMRQADIIAGGQGAPLVPVYHQALVKQAGLELPVAVLNVGGVANVTYVGTEDELIAFDTGPGNALIDDWVKKNGAGDMDQGGEIASKGRVKESVLAALLNNSYFSQEPPKSLDRNHFSLERLEDMSLEWGAMTLTSFTALAASRADFFFPAPPKKWVICGGGVHNPILMAEFQKRLSGEILSAEDLGWSSDFMEAEAFAYLAVRSLKSLPLTFPGTTGVEQPQTGGVMFEPQK